MDEYENANPLAAIINWLLCMQISSVRYDNDLNVIKLNVCVKLTDFAVIKAKNCNA